MNPTLYETLCKKESVYLRQMIEVFYDDYTDEAIAIAKQILNERKEPYADPHKKSHPGKNDMIWGAVWCIGGIIVTLLSIGNGAGVIAYGAIIWGTIQFFRGVFAK